MRCKYFRKRPFSINVEMILGSDRNKIGQKENWAGFVQIALAHIFYSIEPFNFAWNFLRSIKIKKLPHSLASFPWSFSSVFRMKIEKSLETFNASDVRGLMKKLQDCLNWQHCFGHNLTNNQLLFNRFIKISPGTF